jgi:catechol 2,3-dioxygenase-like lactoylglutathione lyase family enzyme
MTLLDHTIVNATDAEGSAAFLTEILGLPAPQRLGPFHLVRVGATTTLDFTAFDGPVHPQHYAFLVTEAKFDAIFDRIRDRGLQYWADPFQNEPGAINTWDGGRGVYFEDPDGHLLEAITRPYGTGGTTTDRPHPLLAATDPDRSADRGDSGA